MTRRLIALVALGALTALALFALSPRTGVHASVSLQAANTATPTATSTATSVIPPPPPPPTTGPTATAVVTAAPTNTATATAVPTALGAQAVLVSSASVSHMGTTAVVRWTMAYQLGVKGFRVYAKQRNLTPRLILPHHSRTYTAHVAWANGGRYTLHILFKNGHSRTKAIH